MWLRDPIWQGIGAIISILALCFAILVWFVPRPEMLFSSINLSIAMSTNTNAEISYYLTPKPILYWFISSISSYALFEVWCIKKCIIIDINIKQVKIAFLTLNFIPFSITEFSIAFILDIFFVLPHSIPIWIYFVTPCLNSIGIISLGFKVSSK
jgi:hypothetical protein